MQCNSEAIVEIRIIWELLDSLAIKLNSISKLISLNQGKTALEPSLFGASLLRFDGMGAHVGSLTLSNDLLLFKQILRHDA
jgi:hypothetical protein